MPIPETTVRTAEYDLEEHVDQLAGRVGALEHLVRLLVNNSPEAWGIRVISAGYQKLLDQLLDDPYCKGK